jgi:hypothetical protein
MSELDVLRRLGDQIVPPPFEALRETARRRVRRTRVASMAAAVAVVAATATTVYLGRDAHREPEPAPAPQPPTSRPVTYADGRTIHYGDRTVEAGGPVAELDLTDDGVGFRTDDGRIWFTDGSTVDPLGAVGATGKGYADDRWPLTSRPGWMLSSNAGSRLVWFEFPAAGEPEVVVYDTSSGQEVARDPVVVKPGDAPAPALVSATYVYWFKDLNPDQLPAEQAQVRYDPATREQARVTEADLLRDLDDDAEVRSIRLKGDARGESLAGFHYSDGMGQQMGLDLRKGVAGVDGVAPVGPGDMVAQDVRGRPFRFDPPRDYTGRSEVAWLVQWLDADTVLVVNPLRNQTDLIACHLDTAACDLAGTAPAGIVVPDFGKTQFIG